MSALPPVKIGRTTSTVEGHYAENGGPAQIPANSLMMIFEVTNQSLVPEDVRYGAILLKNTGEFFDPVVLYDGIWDRFLTPEPGIMEWTLADSLAAEMQGWNIFSTGTHGEVYELKREEEQTGDTFRFQDDGDAWIFVWWSGANGVNLTAVKALAFLYQREPEEYAQVKNYIADLDGVGTE